MEAHALVLSLVVSYNIFSVNSSRCNPRMCSFDFRLYIPIRIDCLCFLDSVVVKVISKAMDSNKSFLTFVDDAFTV